MKIESQQGFFYKKQKNKSFLTKKYATLQKVIFESIMNSVRNKKNKKKNKKSLQREE